MNMLLEIRNLKEHFHVPDGWLHVVDDVPFSLEAGKTLEVVGESGCGESTLGRTIIRFLDPTEREICSDGKRIINAGGKELRKLHMNTQIIFQNPFSSLNPRMTVKQIITEPLHCHERLSVREIDKRVDELMEPVSLASRLVGSHSHELDGGRRQRIGIARALAPNPKSIVCDEPVSALDVSVQTWILNLMQDLQERLGLTYIFITHNLSVAKHILDGIMVMYLEQAVKKCGSDDLFKGPRHPYTKALLSAIPILSLGVKRERIFLKGKLTSPINPRPGCRFISRCPYTDEECFERNPLLADGGHGHFAAYHHIQSG